MTATQTSLRKAATGTLVTVSARPWIKFKRAEDGQWIEVSRMGASKPLTLTSAQLFEVGVTVDGAQ